MANKKTPKNAKGIVKQGRAGPGRPKGAQNKMTVAIKEMIAEALEAEGGVEYLRKVAQTDMKAFCALLGRVIPTQITGEDGGPVSLHTEIVFRGVKADS